MAEPKKPACKLSETDGNIFALGARAGNALKKAGQEEKVAEMQHKILRAQSYHEAIQVIMEYVDVY